ncbi:hypothetical protein MMYC01_205468 [Madurella mycetomatis]|uniref:Vacuolar sorting protein Vps3844 C-terminal domain-containing protein n=1 Tax=Madurella mycetomatis TaxID=100816 RepID=A0A175W0L2_9PEZI|nr:hypothetical protein MMYC01_205468 [Madurella mycetomatis]
MRLFAGLTAAALSGLVVGASQQSADVYILEASRQSSTDIPSLPKEVARHILLQRTSRQRYGSDLRDVPNTIDTETAVGHIARFGRSPAPLFAATEKSDASQLVVIVEGTTVEQSSRLQQKFGQHAAFAISDPPSATANNHLMALFRNLGVASQQPCEISTAINPFETRCWTGPSSVVKYDLRTSPRTLDVFLDNIFRLEKFVIDGDLEVLLVLLPESSRSSRLNYWSKAAAGDASDLRRRRDAETVISDDAVSATTPASTVAGSAAADKPDRRPKAIPQCFNSFDSCMSRTANCSGHGECANKYGKGSSTSCFSCVCKASVVQPADGQLAKGRKTIHWGGNMCQKEDISVPFWLIAGFTVTIVGAITFAIGLLFSVGEEKLPGVIGAGVSRSK